MSLCKYIKLYKCVEATKEDKTLYKSPCIFSLNFCCCSEDFKTPGITSTLNNLPLPVKHCKFLLWGIGPAAIKWQGRTHKWVHCEHMLPCWGTGNRSTRTPWWLFSDLHITGHGHWHCGSMVPILSKLFLHLLTLNDSTKNDKVKNTHLSPVPFYFLNTMLPCSWRRQLRAAVKSREAPCPPLKFFVVYMASYPFLNCTYANVVPFVVLLLGTTKRKTLNGLGLVQFSGALCGQNFCQQYTSNYPDLPSWDCLADNSYRIVLILEKRGCVTRIHALVTVYICQSLLTLCCWDRRMSKQGWQLPGSL